MGSSNISPLEIGILFPSSGSISLYEETFLYSIGLFDPLKFNHLAGKVLPNPFIEMYELTHCRMDVISGETKLQSGESFYYGFLINKIISIFCINLTKTGHIPKFDIPMKFKQFYQIVFLAILPLLANAQQKVFEYDPGISNQLFGIAASYQAFNPSDSSVAIFIIESNNVHGIFCDKNFNIRSKMIFEDKKKEYFALIGHTIEGNTIHLFFSGKKSQELYAVSFNPDNNRTFGTWVPLVKPENEDNEEYIAGINHNNTFCQLFINRKSSTLKLYQISGPANIITQTFNISPKLYGQYFISRYPLDRYKLENFIQKKVLSLATTINAEIMHDLDITSARNKVFSYQNHIIITLDNDIIGTTLIELDPAESKSVTKSFNHLDGTAFNTSLTKTGSFYYRNNLLQLRISNDHMIFTIREVSNDSLIACKEVLSTDVAMQFANQPFIEIVNSVVKKGRISPKKFLNKLWKLDPAITVFQPVDTLEITFGGYMYHTGNAETALMLGGNMTTMGRDIPSEIKIFTIGLFDPFTFNHLEGRVTPNAFIRMERLNAYRRSDISGEIKFREGHGYYYGFYHSPKQKYYLFRY